MLASCRSNSVVHIKTVSSNALNIVSQPLFIFALFTQTTHRKSILLIDLLVIRARQHIAKMSNTRIVHQRNLIPPLFPIFCSSYYIPYNLRIPTPSPRDLDKPPSILSIAPLPALPEPQQIQLRHGTLVSTPLQFLHEPCQIWRELQSLGRRFCFVPVERAS